MRRYECVLLLGLLLGVLVGCTTTATPASMPTVKHYITFKQAYAKAQVAVVEWDKEGVLTSADAYPTPDQSGMATAWSFWISAPTKQNVMSVGQNVGIGIAEKGGEVCVNGEWQFLWLVANKLGCETSVEGGLTERVAEATRCLQEAADNGEIEISACVDRQLLEAQALRIDEIEVDSPEAVSLARQNGWADTELVGMLIDDGIWTLTFSVIENDKMTYRNVEVNAQTGAVKP